MKGWCVSHGHCYAGIASQAAHDGDTPADSLFERPLPSLLKDPEEGRGRIYIVTLFPTGLAWVAENHAIHVLFMPDGPNRTHVAFHFYLVGDAATAEDVDEAAVQEELKHTISALAAPKSEENFQELLDRRAWCQARLKLLREPDHGF